MEKVTKQTIQLFYSEMKKEKLLVSLTVFGLFIGALTGISWVLIFAEFFKTLSLSLPKEELISQLYFLLSLLALNGAVSWVVWRLAHYCSNAFQSTVMRRLANNSFGSMHSQSYRFFSNNFTGSLVKKESKLVRAFETISDVLLWDMFPLVVKLIAILSVLTFLHPVLGAILFGWSVVFMTLNYLLAQYKFKFDIAATEASTKVSGQLADTITNSSNLKLFAKLGRELNLFKKTSKNWRTQQKKAWDVNAHIEAGQGVLTVLFELIIIFAAIKLWEKELIELSDFFIIQAYVFEIVHKLWDFGRNIRRIHESSADAAEMVEIINQPIEVKDLSGAKNLKVRRGEIEFKKVHFHYKDDEELVLKNISFKVKPGEKIALIGPSGGGKSTTVKLLLRLFDIQKGQILIDDQNIANVKQDSLREHVSLVPQDPILFHRTLYENIRYARPNATEKEVLAASKMARCHEFISAFPKKYQTYVGERGVKLSGGQRQRVAIARAILKNAPILILDEATSSLDSESEILIQAALDELIKNHTTFIIAHRLSTIMKADRIFVLDKGRIIEQGTHADLMKTDSSLYKKLWNLQIGGYLNEE